MTLGSLEKHFKEMREQGATDDSEVYVINDYYSHIENIEFDGEDILIIPE